jgi:hypothetical protein
MAHITSLQLLLEQPENPEHSTSVHSLTDAPPITQLSLSELSKPEGFYSDVSTIIVKGWEDAKERVQQDKVAHTYNIDMNLELLGYNDHDKVLKVILGRQWGPATGGVEFRVARPWGDAPISLVPAAAASTVPIPDQKTLNAIAGIKYLFPRLGPPVEPQGIHRDIMGALCDITPNPVRYLWRLAAMFVAARITEAGGHNLKVRAPPLPPRIHLDNASVFLSLLTPQCLTKNIVSIKVSGTSQDPDALLLPILLAACSTVPYRSRVVLPTICTAWPEIPDVTVAYIGVEHTNFSLDYITADRIWCAALEWSGQNASTDAFMSMVNDIYLLCSLPKAAAVGRIGPMMSENISIALPPAIMAPYLMMPISTRLKEWEGNARLSLSMPKHEKKLFYAARTLLEWGLGLRQFLMLSGVATLAIKNKESIIEPILHTLRGATIPIAANGSALAIIHLLGNSMTLSTALASVRPTRVDYTFLSTYWDDHSRAFQWEEAYPDLQHLPSNSALVGAMRPLEPKVTRAMLLKHWHVPDVQAGKNRYVADGLYALAASRGFEFGLMTYNFQGIGASVKKIVIASSYRGATSDWQFFNPLLIGDTKITIVVRWNDGKSLLRAVTLARRMATYKWKITEASSSEEFFKDHVQPIEGPHPPLDGHEDLPPADLFGRDIYKSGGSLPKGGFHRNITISDVEQEPARTVRLGADATGESRAGGMVEDVPPARGIINQNNPDKSLSGAINRLAVADESEWGNQLPRVQEAAQPESGKAQDKAPIIISASPAAEAGQVILDIITAANAKGPSILGSGGDAEDDEEEEEEGEDEEEAPFAFGKGSDASGDSDASKLSGKQALKVIRKEVASYLQAINPTSEKSEGMVTNWSAGPATYKMLEAMILRGDSLSGALMQIPQERRARFCGAVSKIMSAAVATPAGQAAPTDIPGGLVMGAKREAVRWGIRGSALKVCPALTADELAEYGVRHGQLQMMVDSGKILTPTAVHNLLTIGVAPFDCKPWARDKYGATIVGFKEEMNFEETQRLIARKREAALNTVNRMAPLGDEKKLKETILRDYQEEGIRMTRESIISIFGEIPQDLAHVVIDSTPMSKGDHEGSPRENALSLDVDKYVRVKGEPAGAAHVAKPISEDVPQEVLDALGKEAIALLDQFTSQHASNIEMEQRIVGTSSSLPKSRDAIISEGRIRSVYTVLGGLLLDEKMDTEEGFEEEVIKLESIVAEKIGKPTLEYIENAKMWTRNNMKHVIEIFNLTGHIQPDQLDQGFFDPRTHRIWPALEDYDEEPGEETESRKAHGARAQRHRQRHLQVMEFLCGFPAGYAPGDVFVPGLSKEEAIKAGNHAIEEEKKRLKEVEDGLKASQEQIRLEEENKMREDITLLADKARVNEWDRISSLIVQYPQYIGLTENTMGYEEASIKLHLTEYALRILEETGQVKEPSMTTRVQLLVAARAYLTEIVDKSQIYMTPYGRRIVQLALGNIGGTHYLADPVNSIMLAAVVKKARIKLGLDPHSPRSEPPTKLEVPRPSGSEEIIGSVAEPSGARGEKAEMSEDIPEVPVREEESTVNVNTVSRLVLVTPEKSEHGAGASRDAQARE